MSDHGFDSAPFYQTSVTADIPFQGMTVSSNGTDPTSAILWMTTGDHDQRSVPGTLHAFNAADLTELWNSDMNTDRDQMGRFAKFVSPTVANGRAYVPTFSNQVVVYGLLPQ